MTIKFIRGKTAIFAWNFFLTSGLQVLAMPVILETDIPSPAPVGSSIVWSAAVPGTGPGSVWYRFRVRGPFQSRFQTVQEFHPKASWQWVPSQFEGRYEVEVTASNRNTGEVGLTTAAYELTSRVTNVPVISPSRNELVKLYSAPPCASGSQMIVEFTAPDGFYQSTNALPCRTGISMNVYLAGLRAETTYRVQHSIMSDAAPSIRGPQLEFSTGSLSFVPAPTRALIPPQSPGVVLQSRVFENNVATDTAGNVVWYYQRVPYLTGPETGGYFFALFENHAAGTEEQFLRQIDLAGNTVLETNAHRINEQLNALGKHPITSFHHEALRLPNGNILVLAGNERLLTDVQEPGTVDVIGDAILMLDPDDLHIVWSWDAFDHLDVTRKALLDEKCTKGAGGCPAFYLAEVANDWLHGNSLALTPDGDLLYSARHQDWVIKIHFADGKGSGEVVWRLGKDGDFLLLEGGPELWFSHQHYANISDAGANNSLLVFDNANALRETDDSAHSRGQVFELDETARTAKLALNIDLGEYALALGSAEKLSNGNYHFDLGWMPNGKSQMLEYDASGKLVSQLEADTQVYRALRMRDLYTPTQGNWIKNK